MWTNFTNLGRRARLLGSVGAAALVLSAGTLALAQDRGSYRDRGDRYQRATSSSDTRVRTRSDSNTRSEFRGAESSRATVVRNRPAAPQYRHIDRGLDSYRDSYRGNYYRPSHRYSSSSVRVINQINIGSGYSYHRPYRPVYQTYYRPGYHYAKPYYTPAPVYHVPRYHDTWHRPHRSYYKPYYTPYHGGSNLTIRLGDSYPPAPVFYTPRFGFGFYGVSSTSSFGVRYSYRSSYSSYGGSYYSRPAYSHRVVSYSDYAPRSSASITVRYNYRR